MTAGPRTAASSIRLVLSVVPWIIDHPGSSIHEIAERFGQKPAALMKTLEMLSFVGVPPYSPDALIEVRFDGDRVWINFADYFSKPLQLSTGQALALLAAADALRRIEGADPDGSLHSALEKLADATGVTPQQQIDIQLGDAPSDRLLQLRAAAATGSELKITYFAHGKNETSERIIVPRRVRSGAGAWYVDAYCRSAQDERVFRLDRILSMEPVESGQDPPPPATLGPAGEVFGSHGALPTVTLRLGPEQNWVRDSLPVLRIDERKGGKLDVTLAVASETFLVRLLLQLGPEAKVIRSDIEAPQALAAQTARRVLARYRQ
ncbi:MAG: WYL domain-containing protein [Acidimicrobiales bacterium]|nr:WYL domain-containing protein [Acidimicrobiales bacterium]